MVSLPALLCAASMAAVRVVWVQERPPLALTQKKLAKVAVGASASTSAATAIWRKGPDVVMIDLLSPL
jgi:hypothetical protein